MRLRGKVAIVAGAGWGGIGAATALRFAQEGARVIINSNTRPDKLDETVERIVQAGGDVEAVLSDVADRSAWDDMVAMAYKRWNRLDTVVHNASYAVLGQPADIPDEEWDRTLAVTLGGPRNAVRACLPRMIESGGGSFVFVSTVNSIITNPHFGVYSVAKAGLNALTRSVAMEYGRSGIRCNAIAPGQIVGERETERMRHDPLEDQMSQDCYPIGRYGRPDDIASCALFLASDDAAFVTGVVLVADGGLTLQSPEALIRPSFRSRWRDDILVPQQKRDDA